MKSSCCYYRTLNITFIILFVATCNLSLPTLGCYGAETMHSFPIKDKNLEKPSFVSMQSDGSLVLELSASIVKTNLKMLESSQRSSILYENSNDSRLYSSCKSYVEGKCILFTTTGNKSGSLNVYDPIKEAEILSIPFTADFQPIATKFIDETCVLVFDSNMERALVLDTTSKKTSLSILPVDCKKIYPSSIEFAPKTKTMFAITSEKSMVVVDFANLNKPLLRAKVNLAQKVDTSLLLSPCKILVGDKYILILTNSQELLLFNAENGVLLSKDKLTFFSNPIHCQFMRVHDKKIVIGLNEVLIQSPQTHSKPPNCAVVGYHTLDDKLVYDGNKRVSHCCASPDASDYLYIVIKDTLHALPLKQVHGLLKQ